MTSDAVLLPALVWPLTDARTLATAAAQVDDWPALIQLAGREGLAGLLAKRIAEARPPGVPSGILDEFKRVRTGQARRSLRMTSQLVRLLVLFESAGIEALPIKGPALAQDLFGDSTVRTWCDLDIVVRRDAVPQARGLLLQNGFEDLLSYNERLIARRQRTEGQVPLRRSGDGLIVDLHWEMTVFFSSRTLDAHHLLRGSRGLKLLGREVRAPRLIDQLLLAVLHGARHDWRSLELQLVAAVQVERLPAESWPQVCAVARDLGCLRRLAAGVAHACAPFGVPVPPAIRRVLARDRVARRYLTYLRTAAPVRVGAGERANLAQLWWRVRAEDTLLASLDHVVALALYPSSQDWTTADLRPQLEWLYWVRRPFRLAVKYVRGLAGRS